MNLSNLSKNDTIIAPATAPGMGAIAVIRISGPEAIQKTDQFFKSFRKGKTLQNVKSHTAHFGEIITKDGVVLDEVLINVFHDGKSFTGEETIEISCHGSTYITQAIIQEFTKGGIRPADAGEFTMRAYRNGKFDLSQAEAVADLIHSTSQASSQVALHQLRGGVSSEIGLLREKLLNFASLIELELDFSEEDVEFADRTEFIQLIKNIQKLVNGLMESFSLGNAIKNGVPVAIVGEPNVGKSTLLNALLKEDRAIVSSIAGTTRDVIEDEINIGGIVFRFIDTAGIRETSDEIESMGIEKTFEKIAQAQIVLQMFDVSVSTLNEIDASFKDLSVRYPNQKIITILNKADLSNADLPALITAEYPEADMVCISAKEKVGIEQLQEKLSSFIDLGKVNSGDVIICNSRHYSSLSDANTSLDSVLHAMSTGLPSDLLAIDIRAALHSLGEITGEITTDDLLGNIFSKFCIGK